MDKETAIKAILEKIQYENDGQYVDFAVPGYASKKLKAYQSMRGDLLLCKNAITKLTKEKFDDTITTSLYHTIIILYGKCFTDATSSKSPKLEIADCFDDKAPELLTTHKDIMELRHNFSAHRGSTENEIGIVYLKLNIKTFPRGANGKRLKRRMPKTEDLPKYLKLFEHIINIVEAKFEKEVKKVWEHMLKEYKPEHLAMLKIAGPTNK